MAPMKRRRQEDDDEVIGVQTASSSLQRDTQRKKARVSVNKVSSKSRNAREPSTSSSSNESDDEEIVEPESDDNPLPASTQYELLRDGDFEHLKHAELDDERVQKKFIARQRLIGENHAAENAIIEEVTCINFMCHEKLYVKLGPLINFVVGMNGSGKSAVLTAITLCLGGKASATNRGASLKSLIKGGTEQAVLRVKLKNGGVDAYQPEHYGNSIIVERHFSKTGTSGYRLKNSANKVVSTKKGDVDDIIEYYQLQVDNPMNVLTQDAAKSFIQTSTPKQKYQFFIEGVQLQQLDNDYRLISDTCDQIKAKLDDNKAHIKYLKKKQADAQSKADIVDQHVGLRQTARITANQLSWAQVEEVEELCRQQEAVVADVQGKIVRAEGIAEEKGQQYNVTNESAERAEASVRQLEEEYPPLQEELDAAKKALDKATSEAMDAHVQQRAIQLSMRDAENKVEACLKDIAEEEQRIEDAHGGAPSRKQAEIAEARQSILDAKDALKLHESRRPRLEEDLRASSIRLKDIDIPLEKKTKELQDCQKILQTLNNDRENSMAGFDSRMPQLIKRIRSDRGFAETPVGPIGMHVKLLKPEWSQLLETVIGSILTGFIVTSKADQVRLSNILRDSKMEYCQVVIGNNHAFNTNGHEPDPQFETILRILEIDNDLVKRQLIINSRIEQSLVIRNRKDAESVMFDGPRPGNVAQCFTMHASRKDCGHRLGYTGSSNHEITPVAFSRRPPRMKTDIESQISLQRETSAILSSAKNELETRKRELQQAQIKCKQAIQHHERAYKQLKIKIQEAEERVDNLEAEFDQVNVEDGRLENYKAQLAEAQKDHEMYGQTYGNQALEKERLNAFALRMKREHEAVKSRIHELEMRIKKAQSKVKNTRQARQIAVEEKNFAIDAIQFLKEQKTKEESRLERRIAQVDDFTKSAAEICERVPIGNGETATSLNAKLQTYTRRLDAYTQQVGASDEDIYNALTAATEAYQMAIDNFQQSRELHLLLKQSFLKRMSMFRIFQRYISSRSRINFNYLLSERAFRGKLLIDHEKKLLDVHVEPDETTKSSKGRQTKTLSGGEKSFSSICLLLALWEAMGAPLRCLDEFDVFMDDVNRDVSSKMIISAARRSVGRQFILITPKALGSGVEIGADVQIHKLGDPRTQGQLSLDNMLGK